MRGRAKGEGADSIRPLSVSLPLLYVCILLLEHNILYVVYILGDAVVHVLHLFDFVARIQDGGVVSVSQRLSYRHEGQREQFAHEVAANLPGLNELLFLALAHISSRLTDAA